MVMLRAWSCLPSAPWLRQDLENEATPLKTLMRNREGLTPHTAQTLGQAGPALPSAGPRVPHCPPAALNPALGGSEAARCSS